MPDFRILRSFAALSPAKDDVGNFRAVALAQSDVAPASAGGLSEGIAG